MFKTEVYFNKPIYVGQAILDLSKTLMFDFHYNYIKKKWPIQHSQSPNPMLGVLGGVQPPRVQPPRLLFTDTDSFLYEIQTDDFYSDISSDIKEKFDTSNYDPNHKSGILTGVNKKVIGKFKDEVGGNLITHFVGLRPKLYSFKIEDISGEITPPVKKCKGVKKSVVKKEVSFEDYVKCLFTNEKQMRRMRIIKSENHEIYSNEVSKVALSNLDDKRIILENKINTLAIR